MPLCAPSFVLSCLSHCTAPFSKWKTAQLHNTLKDQRRTLDCTTKNLLPSSKHRTINERGTCIHGPQLLSVSVALAPVGGPTLFHSATDRRIRCADRPWAKSSIDRSCQQQ